MGASGQSRNWRGRVSQLQFGSFDIDHPIATFSAATTGSEADGSHDGVLGGEILHRFSVTLDYSQRQMILEPNSALNDPYEDDMSAARLAAEGPDFKTIMVENVNDGTAASEAGIKTGDITEAVDDKSVEVLSLEQIKQMFKRDGARYLLRIRRGQSLIFLTIRIHRQI